MDNMLEVASELASRTPMTMGWDEQVVVDGVVYKPCVIHTYNSTNTTLLVAQ